MKKFLFSLTIFLNLSVAFSQGCDTLFCKPWTSTIFVNQTATICMPAGGGVVLFDGSTSRPTLDTVFFTQQSNRGIGTFISDTCFSYTAYSQPSTAFLKYTVRDTCGNAKICNAYVEIICPTPIIVDDIYTAYSNISGYSIPVSANDIYATGVTPPTVSVLTQPKNGIATGSGLNVLYSGNGFVGQDTLTYVLCNYCGNCDTGILYLDLVECTLPVANDDILSLVQGDLASINVLINDSNLVFGAVASSLVKAPKNGTVTYSSGVVNYQSSATFFGLDTLTYRVCTDCGCDTALLILNIAKAPCTAPDAKVDLVYAGYGLGYTGVYNIIGNDINPIGGGPLVVTLVSNPMYGTASIVNNNLVYTLTDTVNRVDSTDFVLYSLCNDCICDTARVSIVITSNIGNGIKPTIVPDYATVCRNDSVLIKVTLNDFDLEGSYVTLSDTNVNGVVGNPKHGSVYKIDSMTLLYIPNLNFFGLDTFVYQAGDNGVPRLFDQARVFVNIGQCANPPIVVNDQNVPIDTLRITIVEDSTGILCIRFIDADGDWVTTSPAASIDTIQSIPVGLSPTPCLKITPPHDYTGVEGVWVQVCDEYPLCDSVYVIITVTPRPDKPIANDDAAVFPSSTTCFPINVLSNDTDVDKGDSLRISTFTATSVYGGSVTQPSDSILCFLPASSFTGVDTFTYVICDRDGLCDTAIVVVIVPVDARDDNYTINQEEKATFEVKNNDTRFDGEELTICGNPKHGTVAIVDGKIEYTPNKDYPYNPLTDQVTGNGLDTFCYTLCRTIDTVKICDNANVYVTITPKPKFFIPEGFSPSGDGINDNFVIPSVERYPTSQLLVYNRWGDEVWRNDADGYKNDFSGNYRRNGQPLPDGTYYYIFKFNDNVNKDRMGYVIINR